MNLNVGVHSTIFRACWSEVNYFNFCWLYTVIFKINIHVQQIYCTVCKSNISKYYFTLCIEEYFQASDHSELSQHLSTETVHVKSVDKLCKYTRNKWYIILRIIEPKGNQVQNQIEAWAEIPYLLREQLDNAQW